ncbi:ATP-binding cassette domain-containing protein [bacterium]|nr:ATP-binding cassette domain-containing protein [bacterium]
MPTGPLNSPGSAPADEPAPILGVVGSLLRIGRSFMRYPAMCGVIAAALALEMGFTGLVPMSFKYLIDGAIAHQDRAALALTLSALLGALLLVSATGLGRDYLYAKIVSRIQRDLRREIFAHLQRLPLGFYRRTSEADVMARFSIDIAAVEYAVAGVVPWVVLPLMDIAMSTVLLFLLDWRLALVAMLIWPFSLIGPRLFSNRASRESYAYKQEEAAIVAHVQENVAFQPLIKQFGLEADAVTRFHERTRRLAQDGLKVSFISAVVERTANIGISFLQVLTMGVGAYLAFTGAISIGSLVSFQALLVTLSYSVSYVINYLPIVVPAAGALQHIEDLLKEVPQQANAPEAIAAPEDPAHWQLDRVSFAFGATDARREASLAIPRGTTVALVGPSGAGKSALIDLLIGDALPLGGAITVDGEPIERFTRESLRARMAVLRAEPQFLPGSVRENLLLAAPNASPEAIDETFSAVGLSETLLALPRGLDTAIAELRLSPLEWQRFALGRALLRGPRLLILDDATSAMDGESEASFLATVQAVAKDRAAVLIATHRLASIQHAAQIHVLNDGAIVEQGSHSTLLEAGGLYAEWWEKQNGFVANRVRPEWLTRLQLFATLDQGLLTDLSGRFLSQHVGAGREVFREGDAGDRFYLIARGTVEVLKRQADGTAGRVAQLQDGDYFGEIALSTDAPRGATIRTLTPCHLLSLDRAAFLELMERAPAFEAHVSLTMAERTGEQTS